MKFSWLVIAFGGVCAYETCRRREKKEVRRIINNGQQQ
jgi:hypothetical protein